MSQRKSVTKVEEIAQQKADALHQYQDTDGHFSLVRCVFLALPYSFVNVLQEFPTCRPCHHYEWRLWVVFDLQLCPVPPYE